MTDHKRTETLSTRVDGRTLRLAQAVAELRHTTLSRFVADAVEQAVYEALSLASAHLKRAAQPASARSGRDSDGTGTGDNRHATADRITA